MRRHLGERRKLAREALSALSYYIWFLDPKMVEDGRFSAEELEARRRVCLNEAQNALDELRDLNDDIEGAG